MARILVVEDEAIVAADLADLLAQAGHEVVDAVPDGASAVRRAAEAAPDLVLMDVTLRGPVDGIAAAARIRTARPVPVVFLTASSDAGAIRRIGALAAGHVVKPYREADVLAAVERALRSRAPRGPAGR